MYFISLARLWYKKFKKGSTKAKAPTELTYKQTCMNPTLYLILLKLIHHCIKRYKSTVLKT